MVFRGTTKSTPAAPSKVDQFIESIVNIYVLEIRPHSRLASIARSCPSRGPMMMSVSHRLVMPAAAELAKIVQAWVKALLGLAQLSRYEGRFGHGTKGRNLSGQLSPRITKWDR